MNNWVSLDITVHIIDFTIDEKSLLSNFCHIKESCRTYLYTYSIKATIHDTSVADEEIYRDI